MKTLTRRRNEGLTEWWARQAEWHRVQDEQHARREAMDRVWLMRGLEHQQRLARNAMACVKRRLRLGELMPADLKAARAERTRIRNRSAWLARWGRKLRAGVPLYRLPKKLFDLIAHKPQPRTIGDIFLPLSPFKQFRH